LYDFGGEVWVHRLCALWCPEVFQTADDFDAASVKGVQKAVRRANKIVGGGGDGLTAQKCAHCKELGAAIGCFDSRCGKSFHLLCAVDGGCDLNPEAFSLYCPTHASRSAKPTKRHFREEK
jgi:hypothetical protein